MMFYAFALALEEDFFSESCRINDDSDDDNSSIESQENVRDEDV